MRNACDSDSCCGLACDASARDAKSLAMWVERCEPLSSVSSLVRSSTLETVFRPFRSEPRFSTYLVRHASFPTRHRETGHFEDYPLSRSPFPGVAWGKSHVAGGGKSGLTNLVCICQDAFGHHKGQKSAISGRRLHWISSFLQWVFFLFLQVLCVI